MSAPQDEAQPSYRCPTCGRYDDLRVEVTVICRVLQDLDNENVETEPDRHAEWEFNDTSMMMCNACDHTAPVAQFFQQRKAMHAPVNKPIESDTPSEFITELMDLVRDVAPDEYQALMVPGAGYAAIPSYAMEDDDADWWTSDEANRLRDDLIEILEAHAPDFTRFEAREDDGYAFWIDTESLEEAIYEKDAIKVSDLSEVPDGWAGHVVHVNDHGNLTVYAGEKELWSVV